MNPIIAADQPQPWERWSDERRPGDYPREAVLEPWANARVTFKQTSGNVVSRIEIINLCDNKRYLQEPMAMIALKCFGLFLFVLPAYMLVYTLIHCIRLPLVPLINLSPTALLRQVWKIARIPLYFMALEFAALYGSLKPLEGRALFAKFESDLHDGKTRREAEQYQKKSAPDLYWNALTAVENKTSLFVGFCMQPMGKTTDEHILNVEVLPNPALQAV